MYINLTQGSQEWLEYRKEKFNASETASVLECKDAFVKIYDLAEIKYNNKLQFENDYMKQGLAKEHDLRQYVQKKYNLNLTPCVILSDEDDRFSASLDGVDINKNTFCELKFSENEFSYVKQHNKPSYKYYLQVQHQFYVSNIKRCIFCVGKVNLDFDLEFIDIEIKRDDKVIKKIIQAWNKFEKTYKNIKYDDELYQISSELTELYLKEKEIKNKIEYLKKNAIELSNKTEIRVGNMLVYKIGGGTTYDYKGFIKDNNLEIPLKYAKVKEPTWAVKVSKREFDEG